MTIAPGQSAVERTPEQAFGALLRSHRLAAGLTQEELAARAGLGVRSISNMERGTPHTPRKDTVQLLADALALAGPERARLEALARPIPPRLDTGEGNNGALAPGATPTRPTGHNLPSQVTSFIGREQALAQVRWQLTERPDRPRLLTLTGAGGCGKTRLALAVAAELVDQYADGVWLVELAPLADPTLAPGAVAQVLGVREEPGRPLLTTLVSHLKEKRLLLLLDNCEHLVAACSALASTLLRHCPHLRILATSREGLGIAGERCWRVPSLTVPDPKHLPPPELTGTYEAVRLFVARAEERRAGFALTAQNARAVAQICARLDGIPLAIELAAARIGSLSVEGIAARLDDRFRLLTGGVRDVLPHQRTLRAALDWSYDLLSEPEQLLLDRLSVFAGGWALPAAEAVCAGRGIECWEILDLLGGLVNKSLVQAEERVGGEVRFGMLETVRQYGQERLAEASGVAAVRDGHLRYCLVLAEEAEPHLTGPEQGAWLARLEAEHDNLRAALGWARERGAAEGLQLAAALWRFWWIHGYLSEGRAWLEGALAGDDGSAPQTRARALNGAGNLAHHQADRARAAALHEEALTLRRKLGDRKGIAGSLNNLGNVAASEGDLVRAAALHEEALALRRELEDRPGVAGSLDNLGIVAYNVGDLTRAAALHEEALALRRELGDTLGIATSLSNLGLVAQAQGEHGQTATLHEEALALRRELGDARGSAASLNNLGLVAQAQGEHVRAASLLEESLALFRELGDTRGIAAALVNLGWVAQAQDERGRATALLEESLQLSRAIGAQDVLAEVLECLAWVAAAEGQTSRAARLGAAAEALRGAVGAHLDPALLSGHERMLRAVQATLGEEAFTAAWAEGRALSPEDAAADTPAGRAVGSGGA